MSDSGILGDLTVPIRLSTELESVASFGYKTDITIEGIPFNLRPTQENPWIWSVREDRREQFENSHEAGEQTFGYWWLRSQRSFHGGAGQVFSDSGVEDVDISRLRFNTSVSANVFDNPGQITPYAATASTAITTIVRAVPFVRSGVNKIAVARGNNDSVDFYNTSPFAFDTNVSLTEAASVCLDMATDGERLFIAINGKIIRIDEAGTQVDLVTGITYTRPRLVWAKDRLFLANGPSLYEINPNTPAALPAAFYTHRAPGWTWSTGFDGPNAVFFTGYVGLKSEIWSVSAQNQGTGTPVLADVVLQMTLPRGEIAYDIFFYVNSLFVLGTSEGARVGAFTPDGRPQYGPLSFDLAPVRAIGALGPLAFLGSDNGVYTINLGQVIARNGTYAYSHHHNKTSTTGQNYVSIATSGAVGAAAAFYFTDHHLERDSGDGSCSLTTSWFTWNTTELKRMYHVVLGGKISTGTATLTIENYEGDTVTFDIGADPSRTTWRFGLSLAASVAYRATITLSAGTDTNTINSIQLQALPQELRYETIVLPLMCFGNEVDSTGRPMGHDNFAAKRLALLMALAKSNPTVTVTNRVVNVSYQAQIKDVQFTQTLSVPSKQGHKVGGTIDLVLRAVV